MANHIGETHNANVVALDSLIFKVSAVEAAGVKLIDDAFAVSADVAKYRAARRKNEVA